MCRDHLAISYFCTMQFNRFLCRLNSMLEALHSQVVLPHNASLREKMTPSAIILPRWIKWRRLVTAGSDSCQRELSVQAWRHVNQHCWQNSTPGLLACGWRGQRSWHWQPACHRPAVGTPHSLSHRAPAGWEASGHRRKRAPEGTDSRHLPAQVTWRLLTYRCSCCITRRFVHYRCVSWRCVYVWKHAAEHIPYSFNSISGRTQLRWTIHQMCKQLQMELSNLHSHCNRTWYGQFPRRHLDVGKRLCMHLCYVSGHLSRLACM